MKQCERNGTPVMATTATAYAAMVLLPVGIGPDCISPEIKCVRVSSCFRNGSV